MIISLEVIRYIITPSLSKTDVRQWIRTNICTADLSHLLHPTKTTVKLVVPAAHLASGLLSMRPNPITALILTFSVLTHKERIFNENIFFESLIVTKTVPEPVISTSISVTCFVFIFKSVVTVRYNWCRLLWKSYGHFFFIVYQ